jgi:hypothetical protein
MGKVEVELKKKQVRKNNDYHEVFGTAQGKRVLHDLMKTHYVLSTTHVPMDGIATAHNEGERNAVIRILTILKTSPARMQRLMEEASNDVEEY